MFCIVFNLDFGTSSYIASLECCTVQLYKFIIYGSGLSAKNPNKIMPLPLYTQVLIPLGLYIYHFENLPFSNLHTITKSLYHIIYTLFTRSYINVISTIQSSLSSKENKYQYA